MQRYENFSAIACQRFVNGVIHDFIYAMMQPPCVRGADIHAGPLPHGLQPLQHLNLCFVIMALLPGISLQLFFLFCHDILLKLLGVHGFLGCAAN